MSNATLNWCCNTMHLAGPAAAARDLIMGGPVRAVAVMILYAERHA